MELSVGWSNTLVQIEMPQKTLDLLADIWYIHGSQGMNPTDFGDPPAFPLVPPRKYSFVI